MGKDADRKIVNNTEVFNVDNKEFEVIKNFVEFIRGRARGEFYAEIITHSTNTKQERWIKLKFTDQKRTKLEPIN